MTEPALRLDSATVRFGARTLWSDVNLSLDRGEFLAVLGPNGAGKSTFLKVLLGLQRLNSGTAQVLGSPSGAAPTKWGTSHSTTSWNWKPHCELRTLWPWGWKVTNTAFHGSAGGHGRVLMSSLTRSEPQSTRNVRWVSSPEGTATSAGGSGAGR